MRDDGFVWGLVLLAGLFANVPFLSNRVLGLFSRRPMRSVWVRLLELHLLGGFTLLCGFAMESSLGQAAPQRWEFFAAFFCLFATLAFPGFVWRFLVKHD